jgi:multidrug resistance efflux pump
MRRFLGKFLLPLVALAMLSFAILHVLRASQTVADPPPPAEPPRTPFGHTVAGAGIVEAATENISVGSALAGVVLEVYVPVDKVGQQVKAGDPLFRVDDRHLKAQLAYQEASLGAARAQLRKLENQPRPEELPPSAAKVSTAQANVGLQEDLAARARQLRPTGAMSAEETTQRLLSLDVARQQLLQSQAEYALLKAGAWKPDLDIARAAVAQAEAQVLQTRTELERALVRAPVDGEVLKVYVHPGEYVGAQPGQSLVVLGHLGRLHVRVDISEHDIDRFRAGAPARAVSRGQARQEYPLRFVRVEPYVVPKRSLTGDNTERVDTRVLQVIYALSRAEGQVYVGQQLDVFVDVGGQRPRQGDAQGGRACAEQGGENG